MAQRHDGTAEGGASVDGRDRSDEETCDGRKPDGFEADIDDRAELASLRHRFTHWLDAGRLDEADVHDWALILAELASNAVDHGRGTVHVRADWTHDRITLWVTNILLGAGIPRVPADVPVESTSG